MNEQPNVRVRSVVDADASQWARLYAGYRGFYKLEPDDRIVATTWGWVSRNEHGLESLVAEDDSGKLLGFADVRIFARPSSGRFGAYLDDLYTDPESRGRGVGSALLKAVAAFAFEHEANVVRWITAADNSTARSLYDAHASETPWVTYDMQPALGS